MTNLTDLDAMFGSAAVPEDRKDVPDGIYTVTIDHMEWKNAKTSGQLMLAWTLKIADGPYEGRLLWRNNFVATPENMGWLKRDLKVCGVEVAKISELNLEKLLDVKVTVKVAHKGEYQNVYLQQRVSNDPEAGLPF